VTGEPPATIDEMAVTIDEIVVADSPDSWTDAGFRVDEDGTCRVGHVRVRLVGRDRGKRIIGWSLRGLAPDADVDGLPTTVSDTDPCEPAEHANGALLIDHIVLLTPDQPRTVAAFERVGLSPKRTRETDQYGPPFLQTFFRAGEVIIELIGPAEPSGQDPATFFGLAHTVRDLDATKALLGEHLGSLKNAVQPGRRIATLRHKEVGMSVATAFMSPGDDAVAGVDGQAGA
jgi:hypothetical protein